MIAAGLFALAGFCFGFVLACVLGVRHSDRIEREKRDLARQLATAIGHPSARPAGRLRVVGGDGAVSRPGRW